MATQHPDNAFAPYWDKRGDPFVAAHKEIAESLICFKELGTSEYMWDWEGKHADAAVIDKLYTRYFDYFSGKRLGRDKFLTFRIPNIWEEKGYSLLQALSVILSSEDFARDLKFGQRPLFEVILPMTESADQLMHIHKLYKKLAEFKSTEFSVDLKDNTDYLELIPLVESVESQQSIDKLLKTYLEQHSEYFGSRPEYIRPFLARSDPSLVSGQLATVIANKLGIARAYEFSDSTGIPVYPISGVGSLPFRGGLSPATIDKYLKEYPGIRTVSIQSSFRYDHPLAKVKAAISDLEERMPKTTPLSIDKNTQAELESIGRKAAGNYQKTLRGVAKDVMSVFSGVPKRRERRQHIGLLAYGRSMGEQKLPRAITFTAGFYSLGVPPEFIGFGRTLKQLSGRELRTLKQTYLYMADDLDSAGRYFNKHNLRDLAKRNPAWKDIHNDIKAIEDVLGVSIGPRTHREKAHKNLTANVLLLKNKPKELPGLIEETARLRKSLG